MCKRFTADSEGVQQFWTRMESSAVNGRCSQYVFNGEPDTSTSTNLIIDFENHGQPFTQWIVDKVTGKILASTPNGNDMWTYYYVHEPAELRKGSSVFVYHAKDRIKYWDEPKNVQLLDVCHQVKQVRKEAESGS